MGLENEKKRVRLDGGILSVEVIGPFDLNGLVFPRAENACKIGINGPAPEGRRTGEATPPDKCFLAKKILPTHPGAIGQGIFDRLELPKRRGVSAGGGGWGVFVRSHSGALVGDGNGKRSCPLRL